MDDSDKVNKMAMQRMGVGAIIAAAAVSVAVIVLVSGLLATNQSIQNSGNLKTIGVVAYWDRACTNRVSNINWGTLEPGGVKSNTIYVKNNGTAAEVLSMATGNWAPANASTSISLSWNCTGYQLNHGSVVGAVLTLSVSPSTSGISTFGFDIIVTGTEKV
jgi:hypothetical protein